MSKLLITITLFFCYTPATEDLKWDAIYSQATYALNHAKKAMSSNNFDHQKHYSEKALDAYSKIAAYLEDSDDEELRHNISNTINDLKHAVDAPDWDRGRFYTKRVYQHTQDLITTLDLQSEKVETTIE